jgi:single-stranded-DNA-specific exonuclease
LKYKLYNKYEKSNNIIQHVLRNRGIDDYEKYLNLDDSVLIPFDKLDNIDLAVNNFMKHFNNRDEIGIVVDEDVDGCCSASMSYLYIKRLDKDYPVKYILHKRAKAHGLSDDVEIPSNIKLLIIPDAGTNDAMECFHLNHRMDIIILDHHELEPSSEKQVLNI